MKLGNIKSIINPFFDWIQVEVTSYCNASCFYCPNSILRENWDNRHMSIETFAKLSSYFSKTLLIFLQGWGEPFLNPHFYQMVSMAKQAGSKVGTTTNGMLIDKNHITKLIERELDILSFSVAGIDKQQDLLRKNTSFDQIMNTIQSIQKEKIKHHNNKPAIHISYMMLRSGLEKIDRIPEVFAGKGIDQIVVSCLDYIPKPNLKKETIIAKNMSEFYKLKEQFDRIVFAGKNRGLNICFQIYSPEERELFCTEHINRAVFIAADGSVSPCVFTKLPLTHKKLVQSLNPQKVFGNVNHKSLAKIWRKKAYRSFRNSFYTTNLADFCRNCPKLHIVQI